MVHTLQNKRLGLVATTLILALGGISNASANPINIGDQITNGAFTGASLAGWTTTGSANARFAGNPINSAPPNGGGNTAFDNFFPNAFAVLGENTGFITGAPNQGISSLSQTFILPSIVGGAAVTDYRLRIVYRTAFDGDDSAGPNNNKDVFSATLDSTLLFSQNSDPLPDCGPSIFCPDLQITQDLIAGLPIVLTGLAPGAHTITFTLNEAAGALNGPNGTNTAAGIDRVRVVAIAEVPTPGSLSLLGLGLVLLGTFGAARYRSRGY